MTESAWETFGSGSRKRPRFAGNGDAIMTNRGIMGTQMNATGRHLQCQPAADEHLSWKELAYVS